MCSEQQRRTLIYLLETYPDGLNGVGWDFEILSYNKSLPFSFVRTHLSLPWNWSNLSRSTQLDDEIVEEFKDFWDWGNLALNRSLSPRMMILYGGAEEKYSLPLGMLFKNRSITREVLEFFVDKLYWKVLAQHEVPIDPDFILKHLDKIDDDALQGLCTRVDLSRDFILGLGDKADWEGISRNHTLTRELISEFRDRFNHQIGAHRAVDMEFLEELGIEIRPRMISYNPNLSSTYIRENYEWLDPHVNHQLLYNPGFKEDLIIRYLDECIAQKRPPALHWLSSNPNLTLDTLLKYPQFINNSHLEKSSVDIHNIQYRWDWGSLRHLEIDETFPYLRDVDPRDLIEGRELNLRLLDKLISIEELHVRLGYDRCYHLSKNSSIPYEYILDHPEFPWVSTGLSARTYEPATRGRRTKSAKKR